LSGAWSCVVERLGFKRKCDFPNCAINEAKEGVHILGKYGLLPFVELEE